MGLTYHFRLGAPAKTSAATLASLLREVELEAARMGLGPNIVLDAPFDSEERRLFARRLTIGRRLEDPRLRNVRLPGLPLIWSHDPAGGACVVGPEHGVALVVTNERGEETVFGFFRYPAAIRDLAGDFVMPVPDADAWSSSEFLKTADPRYRRIIRSLAARGLVVEEHDDYGVQLAEAT